MHVKAPVFASVSKVDSYGYKHWFSETRAMTLQLTDKDKAAAQADHAVYVGNPLEGQMQLVLEKPFYPTYRCPEKYYLNHQSLQKDYRLNKPLVKAAYRALSTYFNTVAMPNPLFHPVAAVKHLYTKHQDRKWFLDSLVALARKENFQLSSQG